MRKRKLMSSNLSFISLKKRWPRKYRTIKIKSRSTNPAASNKKTIKKMLKNKMNYKRNLMNYEKKIKTWSRKLWLLKMRKTILRPKLEKWKEKISHNRRTSKSLRCKWAYRRSSSNKRRLSRKTMPMRSFRLNKK